MNISVVDLITSPSCPRGAELLLLPVKRNQDPPEAAGASRAGGCVSGGAGEPQWHSWAGEGSE